MADELNPTAAGQLSIIPADPTNSEASSISIAPLDTQGVTYNSKYTGTKATRYAFALGDKSPGIDTLYGDVSQGNGVKWDELLAANQDVQNQKIRMQLVGEIARNRDPRATPTTQELDLVQNLTNDELFSPNLKTILNQKFSEKYNNLLVSLSGNVSFQNKANQSQEAALQHVDNADVATQRALIAQDKLEEIEKRAADRGWLSTGAAFVKTLIPGYTNLTTRDSVKGMPTSLWLTGNNIQEQLSYLYSLPPARFDDALTNAINEIEKSNPLLAKEFAQSAVSFSSSDKGWGNVGDVLDALTVPGSGKAVQGLKKAGQLIKEGMDEERAIQKIAGAGLHNPTETSKVAGELGLHDVAAKADVAESLARGDPGGLMPLAKYADNPQVIESRLPDALSPGRAFEEKLDMSSAARNRAQEAILRAENTDLVQNVVRVDRLEPHQLTAGAEEAMDTIKDTFQNVSHNIIDFGVHPASEDKLTNLYSVSVRFGKRDGTLFPSEKSAQMFVLRNIGTKTRDYEIKQQGIGGYYVEVRRNINETGAIRDLTIPTEFKTPDTLSNQLLHGIKSADYQLPQPQVNARGRVVYSTGYMADKLSDMVEPISKLSKSEKAELQKVLDSNSVNRQWFRTENDFRSDFIGRNGKAPSKAQYDAYESFVNTYDLDYAIRDADMVTQKARLGGERISFKTVGTGKDGKPGLIQKEFDGVVVDSLPWASKDGFMVQEVANNRPGFRYYSKYALNNKKQREAIDRALEEGAKIVLNPQEATYYITKNFQRDRIPLGSLGFNEGGHHEYKFPYFVKQADVILESNGIHKYRGDLSVASAPTAEHASEVTKLLEQGRQLVLNKDPSAKKFFDDNLSDFMSMGDFMKRVKSGTIKLDVPFVATRKGQRSTDLEAMNSWKAGKEFLDVTQNEHNVFAGVGGRYIGEQAEYLLDVLQSEGSRIVKTTHSPLLNPYETFRTSTQNLLDTFLAKDYISKAVSDWTQEFGHLFDVDNINRVYSNPLHYLQNVKYKTGVDSNQLRAAENFRIRTLTLNNYQSAFDRQIMAYKDSLVDWGFNTGGEFGRSIMNDKLLPAITNSDTFLRASAYHSKLGFFNPKQLFLQASDSMKIAMISPTQALPSVRQFFPTMLALNTENESVLRGLANRYSKFMGVDKQDWLNMVDAYKRSGFSIVAHDQGYLDTISKVGGKGAIEKVLDAGTTPFKVGEQSARTFAWSAAWGEFRAANPGKVATRYDETAILQRAKDLTNNMSRDSNAAWQKGPLSIVTQFMSYQARFMEQLWDGGLLSDGRKLTRAEKLRVVVGMSALYGVPAGVTGVVGVWPIKEAIKDWMTKNDYPYDDTILEPFMDGVLPTMVEAMTGNDLDFSQTYGPSGIPAFHDLLNGDKTWVETLSGAAGGVLADTLKSTLGSTANIVHDIVNINKDEGQFKMVARDLLEPLQNISTVDNGVKLWRAINTGRWLSKSGSLLSKDVNVTEALSATLMGLPPQRLSDAYSKFQASKDMKAAQNAALKDIRSAISKGTQAANEGDMDAARIYYRRARSAAVANDIPLRQYNSAVSQGLTDTPLTDRADETFSRMLNKKNIWQNQPE